MLPFSSAPWASPTALKGNCLEVATWPRRVAHGYPQRAGARVEMCFCSLRNQTREEMTVAASHWLMVSQLCSCIPRKAGSYRALSQGCAHVQHPCSPGHPGLR